MVAPCQVILELRDDKLIDHVLVHEVALFGTTYRKFGGARKPRIFRNVYAVPQEKGGHLFVRNVARARKLIQEMRDENMTAAAAARAAALKAEADAAARHAKAETKAARKQEEVNLAAIRSAFETLPR